MEVAPSKPAGTVTPLRASKRWSAAVREMPFVYPAAAAVIAVVVSYSLGLFGSPHAADPNKDKPVPDPTAPHVDTSAPAPVGPSPAAIPKDAAKADGLRAQAKAALAKKDPNLCLRLLAQAAELDADGDKRADVNELREKAARLSELKGPPR